MADALDQRDQGVTALETEIQERDGRLVEREQELESAIEEQRSRLEQIAGLTVEQAKAELLRSMENEARIDAANVVSTDPQVIEYVEARAAHPEAIAMWCMMGNYHLGAAEPVLWDDTNRPEIGKCTERFVKVVWPAFRAAGKRPKAAPILLPIFEMNQMVG